MGGVGLYLLSVPRTLAALVLLFALGCDDLSRFRTNDRTVFRGEIVGDEAESFIRRGFAPGTELMLDFDPLSADGPAPGSLTTSPDPITGVPVFDATPLEPIAPLQHDLLSEYDLPGAGRVRNYLYLAHPSAGPLARRDTMVFISLLDDGGAEVRVITGSGDEASGDHFGLFRMQPRPR